MNQGAKLELVLTGRNDAAPSRQPRQFLPQLPVVPVSLPVWFVLLRGKSKERFQRRDWEGRGGTGASAAVGIRRGGTGTVLGTSRNSSRNLFLGPSAEARDGLRKRALSGGLGLWLLPNPVWGCSQASLSLTFPGKKTPDSRVTLGCRAVGTHSWVE